MITIILVIVANCKFIKHSTNLINPIKNIIAKFSDNVKKVNIF